MYLHTTSVVVLEETPCPRGPIFKSLSLSSEVQLLENFRGLSRLATPALTPTLCAGVSAGVAMTYLVYGWYSDNSVFLEDPVVYLRPSVDSVFLSTRKVLVLGHQVLVLVLVLEA